MEAKFTRGPWKVTRAEFTDEGVNFEVIMPEQRICALDAKLIAASPLLYEALKSILCLASEGPDAIGSIHTLKAIAQAAQDALRSARGEK